MKNMLSITLITIIALFYSCKLESNDNIGEMSQEQFDNKYHFRLKNKEENNNELNKPYFKKNGWDIRNEQFLEYSQNNIYKIECKVINASEYNIQNDCKIIDNKYNIIFSKVIENGILHVSNSGYFVQTEVVDIDYSNKSYFIHLYNKNGDLLSTIGLCNDNYPVCYNIHFDYDNLTGDAIISGTADNRSDDSNNYLINLSKMGVINWMLSVNSFIHDMVLFRDDNIIAIKTDNYINNERKFRYQFINKISGNYIIDIDCDYACDIVSNNKNTFIIKNIIKNTDNYVSPLIIYQKRINKINYINNVDEFMTNYYNYQYYRLIDAVSYGNNILLLLLSLNIVEIDDNKQSATKLIMLPIYYNEDTATLLKPISIDTLNTFEGKEVYYINTLNNIISVTTPDNIYYYETDVDNNE